MSSNDESRPVQESLFDVGPDESVGYRVPTALQVVGITYRQLDYWDHTKLVQPSVRPARGSGSQRLYSFRDIVTLKIVKRLLDTGISLRNIRLALDKLHDLGVEDLAQVTLVSDGTTVYACTTADEVIDLLEGGQGVFGIALPGVLRELTGSIAEFPSERLSGAANEGATDSGSEANPVLVDDLAAMRRRKSS